MWLVCYRMHRDNKGSCAHDGRQCTEQISNPKHWFTRKTIKYWWIAAPHYQDTDASII
jgi:hypothetical protein